MADHLAEGELIMDREVRGAFDELRKSNEAEHKETRGMITRVEERLSRHLIDAGVEAFKVAELVAESKGRKRWFWSMVTGVVLALAGAAFAVILKVK